MNDDEGPFLGYLATLLAAIERRHAEHLAAIAGRPARERGPSPLAPALPAIAMLVDLRALTLRDVPDVPTL